MSLANEDADDLQKAYNLHQAGRLNEAAGLYRSLIQRNTKNFQALHLLGLIEASFGNFEQAKALMARSLEKKPPNIQFVENYATVLLQNADYGAVIDNAQYGLKFNKSAALYYLSAVALFKLDRYSESLEQFD